MTIAVDLERKATKTNKVYKFKQIVGKPYFSDKFKKIVKRYIRV